MFDDEKIESCGKKVFFFKKREKKTCSTYWLRNSAFDELIEEGNNESE